MSEIEKMRRHIERTKFPKGKQTAYCICFGEIKSVGVAAREDMAMALELAFEYGRAKGYRAAKAERRATA